MAKTGEVGGLGVVGAVDEAQVVAAADLQAGLRQGAAVRGGVRAVRSGTRAVRGRGIRRRGIRGHGIRGGGLGGAGQVGGGQVGGGLYDHALSPGGGEVLPPAGGRGGRFGVGGVDGDAAGGRDQVGAGGGQAVGEGEVPPVGAVVVDGALGRQELERGDADAGQVLDRPAVAEVGV